MDSIVDVALMILNVVLGVTIVAASIYYYRRIPIWIKIYYAIVGLFWIFVFVYMLLSFANLYRNAAFAHNFIRPGITFTLGALAASSLIGVKKRLEIWNGST